MLTSFPEIIAGAALDFLRAVVNCFGVGVDSVASVEWSKSSKAGNFFGMTVPFLKLVNEWLDDITRSPFYQ